MSADTNLDPRERAQSSVDQEMSQDSRRAYSAVAQAGLNGNSPQPNVICHDQDYLKDASISNDLPKHPCSLYFHLSVTNFTIQSLLQDVKRFGINIGLLCYVPRKLAKMPILLPSRPLKIVICFLRTQDI